MRIQLGRDLTITVPVSSSEQVFRYSATLGGILTVEANTVEALRMDLLSAGRATPTGLLVRSPAVDLHHHQDRDVHHHRQRHRHRQPPDVQRGVRLTWPRSCWSPRPGIRPCAVCAPARARRGVRGSKPRASGTCSAGYETNHNNQHKSIIQFDPDWAQVGKLAEGRTAAPLGHRPPSMKPDSRHPSTSRPDDYAQAQLVDRDGGGEGGWTGAVDTNDLTEDPNYKRWYKVNTANGALTTLDVTSHRRGIAPKTV